MYFLLAKKKNKLNSDMFFFLNIFPNKIITIIFYFQIIEIKEKHFPTVTRQIAKYRYNREARDVLPHIIQKICEAIENAYGRLAPSVYDSEEYDKNRMTCLQEIINDKHFSENNGPSFINVISPEEIDDWIAKSEYFTISLFCSFKLLS